jgi:hypothetical protein
MADASVGRIVHYVSYGSKGGKYPETCRAAIVTEVSGEREDPSEIGIAVLNPTGVFFDRQVRQDEDDKPGGTWHWPERTDA